MLIAAALSLYFGGATVLGQRDDVNGKLWGLAEVVSALAGIAGTVLRQPGYAKIAGAAAAVALLLILGPFALAFLSGRLGTLDSLFFGLLVLLVVPPLIMLSGAFAMSSAQTAPQRGRLRAGKGIQAHSRSVSHRGDTGQAESRFPIRMGPAFAAGRLFYFATSANSYVEVEEDRLIARMGWFRLKLRGADIGRLEKQEWRWNFFSGWTVWWAIGTIIFGSPGDVVYLEIRQPVWTFATGIPMRVRDVFLSVEDPGHLINAINSTKRREPTAAHHVSARPPKNKR